MASYDITGYDDLVSSFDSEDDPPSATMIEETIDRMQGMGMCFDPVHFHSFRSVLLPPVFHSCAFCERKIHLDAAVKCIACGIMVHRTCGLQRRTKPMPESLQCKVNGQLLAQQPLPVTPSHTNPTTDSPFSPEAFPAMAQALQDNVMTSYNKTPPRKKVSPYPAQRTRTKPADPPTTLTEKDDSRTGQKHDPDQQPEKPDQQQENEEENPPNLAQQLAGNINVGILAGSLAGGVAGLALAGPAGAYAGYISAGSILVEGGVAWSLVAAGIGMGGLAAGRQQQRKRVLELGGENGNSTVILVRPSVQVDPIWNTFYAEAQRTAPLGKKNGNRDQDIFETGEEEIDTNDKILLLVNRTLNDKSSVSGHVFRHLVKVFHDRCKVRTKLCRTNDSIAAVSPRARRDDVHAVIKFVTASLMEERPELGASPHFTEITATAVESLVFGLLYDALFEEIVEETSNRDVELWRKITTFEQQCRGAKESLQSLVSEPAVEALKMLPGSHSTGEKLLFCVKFLDAVSEHFVTQTQDSIGADSLIKMVCQHLVLIENSISCYSQVAFLEEFSRDEELLRGREGYALVTLQACLHLLQASTDLQADVFYTDSGEPEEPVKVGDESDTEDRDEEKDAISVMESPAVVGNESGTGVPDEAKNAGTVPEEPAERVVDERIAGDHGEEKDIGSLLKEVGHESDAGLCDEEQNAVVLTVNQASNDTATTAVQQQEEVKGDILNTGPTQIPFDAEEDDFFDAEEEDVQVQRATSCT